jgi:hypothetical protein
MNKTQVAKQNRNKGLELIIDANQLVWNSNLKFKEFYEDEFKVTVADIDKAAERQKAAITGVALDKLNKKTDMTSEALRVAGATKAWAQANNNQTVFDKVDYTQSELMGAGAVTSRNRCQIIYDQAKAVETSLIPYGIDSLDPLEEKIDAFNLFISAPKNAKALIKTATEEVKVLTKKADTILKRKITPMMELFRTSSPKFYADYHNNLRIDKIKTIFTELKIVFRDKTTKHTLEGVMVKATGEEHTYDLISNSSGVADEKQIKPEIYDLEFDLPGYKKEVLENERVKLGTKLELVVELTPLS